MRDYAEAINAGYGNFGKGAGRVAYRLLSEGADPEKVQGRVADAAIIAAGNEKPPKTLSPADAWNIAGEIRKDAAADLDAEQRQQERLRLNRESVEQEGAVTRAVQLTGDRLACFQRPSEIDSRPIEWVVEGLVPAGMLTLLHATDKAGKTLLAWELARAVVAGQPFLVPGFPVRRGRVLMALLDDAAPINAFRRDLFGLTAFDEDVWMLTEYPEANGMPLPPERVIGKLREACEVFQPSLVILDALYQFTPTTRDAGSDAARMTPLMHLIDSLRKCGAGVVLIAHDRKDEDDVAGSHVIRAKAKQRLHLQKYPLRQPPRDGEPRAKDTGKRLLRVTGKLGSEAIHALMLRHPGRFEYVSDDLDAAREQWGRERQASTETVVMRWLNAGNAGTVDDLTSAIGRRREDVHKALKALLRSGDLETYMAPKPVGSRGPAPTGYRLREAADPREDAHEGTSFANAASPCETSPSANRNSFRSKDSTRNEFPPAETLERPRGTSFPNLVPSSALSLGSGRGNSEEDGPA